MSKRRFIAIGFVAALALTVGGWYRVMWWKGAPPGSLALWFPLIRLLKLWDLDAVIASLLQFPLFAAIFAVAMRWSRPVVALCLVVALYAACVVAALLTPR